MTAAFPYTIKTTEWQYEPPRIYEDSETGENRELGGCYTLRMIATPREGHQFASISVTISALELESVSRIILLAFITNKIEAARLSLVDFLERRDAKSA
ncbi:MAG: hypothetical protein NVS3B16_24680 [Vulcanimicrobiaceae bacterium]